MSEEREGAATPMPRIYVIGHRQPDTDSICSVIAYAELLNSTESGTYIPARCGELNEESSYVLSRFGVRPPLFVESVEPCVSDLPFLDTRSVQQSVPTIAIAAQMDANDMRNMPVVDGQHRLIGLVSEYGLARAYVKRQKIEPLSLAPISLSVLAQILNAEVLVSAHTSLEGSVYIAIDALHVTLSRLTEKDVAIVGDNEPAQLAILSAGIAALIVADGAPVGERVIGAARARGVSLLTTSLDAFGVGKMINLCLPGSMIMESDIPTVRMEDSLEFAKHVISTSKFRTAMVTREDGTFVGQISRSALMQDVHKRVILLDHNEAQQAVEGIEEAEILEIIDHHRLGAITTLKPVKFLNDPVGSTSTIIARKYREAGITPGPMMAELLLAGILSDTLALKMSTTTRADREAVESLSGLAGLDLVAFGAELVRKGMNLAGLPLEEVLGRDTKRYSLFGKDVIIAQVMVPSFVYNREREEEIRSILDALRGSHRVDLYIVLFTDVLEEASEVYIAGEDAVLFRLGFRDQPRHMQGIMSRKKDFLPQFGSLLRSM
jgi:manganese-dependent inorganic pyrophosphatase